MNLILRQNKQYVYCGNNINSMFAEVVTQKNGGLTFGKTAIEEGPPTDPDILKRLIAKVSPSPNGRVSIAFPLQLFEILSLSLPLLPDQAIGKALPYHIAKAINKPISEFIYDYQVNKKMKDQMQISVYLFPLSTFNAIKNLFEDKRLEVTYFEADAFAAFAYLDMTKLIDTKSTSLCVLIWPQSLTLGVCEAGKVKLARSIVLHRPTEEESTVDEDPTEPLPQEISIELPEAEEEVDIDLSLESAPPDTNAPFEGDMDEKSASILSGFDLISSEFPSPQKETLPQEPREEESDSLLDLQEQKDLEVLSKTSMQDYFDSISIEIMRTRDYFGTVIKGKPITSYYVIGAGNAFDKLRDSIKDTMGEEAKRVTVQSEKPCGTELYVVALGAGTRWL